MTQTPADINASLTPDERAALYFIPEALGGKTMPEPMQQRLQDLGLATAPGADGKRGITVLGDSVKRAKR